jgi:hypothetical protein
MDTPCTVALLAFYMQQMYLYVNGKETTIELATSWPRLYMDGSGTTLCSETENELCGTAHDRMLSR